MISVYMTGAHRHCDEHFAKAEEYAANLDLQAASDEFTKFYQQMEQHFSMEEQVLFPAFEAATGSRQGPTQVMRMEHTQMRALFEEMRQSLVAEDSNEYLGQGETLLILMQQHNMKEERILYPMADEVLARDSEQLLAQMKAL